MTTTLFPFHDTLVVIVLYKELLAESKSFNSLTNGIPKSIKTSLFVFDNSPTPGSVPFSDTWDITYQHEPSNAGVSRAYNEGCRLARALKKKWLLLADQDTEFPGSLFFDYQKGIEKFPEHKMFVPFLYDSKTVLSPFRLVLGKGVRARNLTAGIHSLKKFKVINSGILISVAAFEQANGYNEQFALDYSDIVFCDRLMKNDLDFVLIDSECYHNFSGTVEKTPSEILLIRFISFCKAVMLYKKTSIHVVSVSWIIYPRALKLFFKTGDVQFIKTALRYSLK